MQWQRQPMIIQEQIIPNISYEFCPFLKHGRLQEDAIVSQHVCNVDVENNLKTNILNHRQHQDDRQLDETTSLIRYDFWFIFHCTKKFLCFVRNVPEFDASRHIFRAVAHQ
ncbi:Uncharacterised protein at_DN1117 [Pycnogonum litorale]